jgi:hypothetical protein
MEGVEIQAKDSENQLLWKKKDGSLVNISTLSDSELIEARKISSSLMNKYYNFKEKALYQVKKCADICDLHTELLEQLDEELIVRKKVYAKKAELLMKAEQDI